MAADDRLNVKVFYTWEQSQTISRYDPGFRREVEWDIPLLEGYEYEFVRNIAPNPGSFHFWGIVNTGLCKKVTAWKPDLVLVYGWSYYSHLALMYRLHGKIRIGFRGDSHMLGQQSGIKNWLKTRVIRTVYRYIDVAYYVGTHNKAYFRHAGLDDSQLVFAPHSIDNTRFQLDRPLQEQKAKQWRAELGIPESSVVFLYAGKFILKKNLFRLIQAFKQMNNNTARLVLAGSGIMEKVLRKLAEGDGRILFLPFQNQTQMPILYRLGDVFVLPSSFNETWGLGVNEAMACGRAIICSTQVGCAADLVRGGENGFVIAPDNVDGFTAAMAAFAKDEAMLAKAKEASLKKISDWSVNATARSIANHVCTI
ncbi:MAG TPA: glycosyltransferase family 4 protein [Chitinophagaceae bacterium]|nr:glycosyltransferase family 4 protein [Chitinophagaceae bacterium]